MLEFKKIELSDYEVLNKYVALTGRFSCESNFVNLLVWQCAYNNMYAIKDGQLFIKSGYDWDENFRLPLGDDLEHGMELLREYTGKENPPLWVQRGDRFDEFAKRFVDSYELFSERDAFDYIYLQEDLASLSGKKYHSKRNHIAAFSKQFNWEFKTITKADAPEILECASKWYSQNAEKFNSYMACEKKGIEIILENFDFLKIKGGAIYVEGQMVAFTLGSPITPQIFDINIEKALPDYAAAYTVINNEFAKTLTDYKYINREDDMGLEGLRKAKLSYKPVILLEKYYCIPKSERMKQIYHDAFAEGDNSFEDALFKKCPQYIEALEDKGKIASLCFKLPCKLEGREVLYLFAVVTDKDQRGKGFGKALIEKIKAENRDKLLVLRPVNQTLIPFYEQLGFKSFTATNQKNDFALNPVGDFADFAKDNMEQSGNYTAMYYSEKQENLENLYFPYSMA